MEGARKNIDQLFVKARQEKVNYPIQNVNQVLSTNAIAGGSKIVTSFFNLSTITIMVGSLITALVIGLSLNQSNTEVVESEILQLEISKEKEIIAPKLKDTTPISFYEGAKYNISENKVKIDESLPLTLPDDAIKIEEQIEEETIVAEEVEEQVIEEEKVEEIAAIESGAFSSVVLNISADVVIKKGNESICTVLDSDLTDMVLFEITNEVLYINLKDERKKSSKRYLRNNSISIELTMKTLNGVMLNGNGDIYIADEIPTKNLYVGLSGSGDIQFEQINPENFNIDVSGYISLKGNSNVNKAEINIAG